MVFDKHIDLVVGRKLGQSPQSVRRIRQLVFIRSVTRRIDANRMAP